MSCRQRDDDSKQTDWSKWLYDQGTGSFVNRGLTFNDVDTLGFNYNNDRLVIIETKEHLSHLRYSQQKLLELEYNVHTASMGNKFRGVFVLRFHNTNPANGDTTIQTYNGRQWVRLDTYYSSSTQVNRWLAAELGIN